MKALEEFVMFDDSIGLALNITYEDETLVVVTADHSHTISIGGFASRGDDILGLTENTWKSKTTPNLTFTTLLYANGPGGLRAIRTRNLTHEETCKSVSLNWSRVDWLTL
jgi:alkaline phosphatase